MGGLAGYLRLLAIILALGLTGAILLGPTIGVDGELPFWLLILPIFLLMIASWLASRARTANIKRDGTTQDRPGDER